jgi:hypothetical protein
MEFRFYVALTFIQHSVPTGWRRKQWYGILPMKREEFRMLFDNSNTAENFNRICKANDNNQLMIYEIGYV